MTHVDDILLGVLEITLVSRHVVGISGGCNPGDSGTRDMEDTLVALILLIDERILGKAVFLGLGHHLPVQVGKQRILLNRFADGLEILCIQEEPGMVPGRKDGKVRLFEGLRRRGGLASGSVASSQDEDSDDNTSE